MMFKPLAVAAFAALATSFTSAQDTVVDIVVGSEDHTVLTSLLNATGLVAPLLGEGPFTVFAPEDDAFEDIPSKYVEPEWILHLVDILLYHVAVGNVTSADLAVGAELPMLNGGSTNITSLDPPMVNQADIDTPDVFAGNGVVHVIDEVLLPFSATNDIVTAAIALPELFSTLVSLVVAADLVETLQSEGPFTVFAPTNEAFAKLDNETVTFLTSEDGLETLTDILLYHVFPGMALSAGASSGELLMANGQNSTITVPMPNITMVGDNATDATDATAVERQGDGNATEAIMINDASVILADFLVNNGIIHVIDTVILPPSGE